MGPSAPARVLNKYDTPSPDRGRWRSAQHESAHSAAAFLFGRRIHSVSITPPRSSFTLTPEEKDDLASAIEDLVICFAAEAHVRLKLAEVDEAFAEYVGARFVPPDETTLLESIGTSPAQALALDGLRAGRENPKAYDHRDAEQIAESVTSDQLEADALLRFAALRTAALVQTPHFRTLTDRLAPLLELHGALDGETVMDELRRAGRDERKPIDRTLASALESLMEEDMDSNGHESVSGDRLKDVFGAGAGRAIFHRKPDPDSFNVSGQWKWAERDEYLRSIERNEIQDDNDE
jgi:hypothetical protein